MRHAQDAATRHQWEAIWTVPAVMAVVVAILFMLFFKDPPRLVVPMAHSP